MLTIIRKGCLIIFQEASMNNTTTKPPIPVETSGLFIWATVYGGVAVAVVAGNSIIITAFCLNKKLLHTRTNYFLVSLAVADLLVGSLSIPMYVYDIFAYLQQTTANRLDAIYSSIDIFTAFASIFALVLVALERAYSVTYPHKHRLVNRRVYFILILSVWIIASWLGALNFYGAYQLKYLKNKTIKNALSYLMMVLIFISLMLITSAYISIWRRVRAPTQSLHKSRSQQENRLAKTLIIVTCAFFFCWLPFYTIMIVIFYCRFCYHLQVVYFCKLLQYSNSLANVLIYTLRIRDFRHTVSRLFCRDKQPLSLPSLPTHKQEVAIDRNVYHECHTANEVHLMNIADIDSSSPKEQDSLKVENPTQLLGPNSRKRNQFFTSYSV